MWLGAGVIGGIGLGLGYISPVSTLIKWFPDRRGMATGMAIMGFGGGAMIGSPLSRISCGTRGPSPSSTEAGPPEILLVEFELSPPVHATTLQRFSHLKG